MTSSTRSSSTSHARTCCWVIFSRTSAVCIAHIRGLDLLHVRSKAGEGKGFPVPCQAGLRRAMVKYRRGERVPALCLPGPQAAGTRSPIRLPDTTARGIRAEGLEKNEIARLGL